jgi:hypothetical protein
MTDDVIPVGNVPLRDLLDSDFNDHLLHVPGFPDASLAKAELPKPLRIVHTSDTHLQHGLLVHSDQTFSLGGVRGAGERSPLGPFQPLPDGDVLIHSGDFNRFFPSSCVRSLHYEDLLHEVIWMYLSVTSFVHSWKCFLCL